MRCCGDIQWYSHVALFNDNILSIPAKIYLRMVNLAKQTEISPYIT